MASGNDEDKKIMKKCSNLLKPLNSHNLLFYYCPAIGTASYTTLSISVMNPSLNLFLPKRDLTNFLLVNSLVGTGCYIYSRRHMEAANKAKRLEFAAVGSTVFCFSSVLLWAVLRSFLPENYIVGTAVGIASSIALVTEGINYLGFIDKQVAVDKK